MGRAAILVLASWVLACAGERPVEGTMDGTLDPDTSAGGEVPERGSGERGEPTSDGGDDAVATSSEGGADESSTGALDPDEPAPTKQVAIVPGRTKDAERVATLPVARAEPNAERRVVLRLAPDELPSLQAGDRLITPAEVQVTTRCDVGQSAPGCGYDPTIRAQILLSGDRDDTDPGGAGSLALTQPQTQTCTKGEHHCMFVFRPADATVVLDDPPPCVADGSCHVNVVMWAWDPQARSGGVDEVLVGENEGDYLQNGVVGPDKARLMAVRERALVATDRELRETDGGGELSVPSDASATLVYSHRIADALAKDEQVLIEAKLVTAVGGRARVSSKLIVSHDPDATDGGAPPGLTPNEIGEHNGINCTAGQSPCTTRKVAVLRATADVDGPIFVNVVVHGAVPGGGATSITVKRGQGFLRSTRYDAAHRG